MARDGLFNDLDACLPGIPRRLRELGSYELQPPTWSESASVDAPPTRCCSVGGAKRFEGG